MTEETGGHLIYWVIGVTVVVGAFAWYFVKQRQRLPFEQMSEVWLADNPEQDSEVM